MPNSINKPEAIKTAGPGVLVCTAYLCVSDEQQHATPQHNPTKRDSQNPWRFPAKTDLTYSALTCDSKTQVSHVDALVYTFPVPLEPVPS